LIFIAPEWFIVDSLHVYVYVHVRKELQMISIVKRKKTERKDERLVVLMTKSEAKAIKKYLGGEPISAYLRNIIIEKLREVKPNE